MVVVAQLVEPRIVIPVVEGSSPFSHPIFSPENRENKGQRRIFLLNLNQV